MEKALPVPPQAPVKSLGPATGAFANQPKSDVRALSPQSVSIQGPASRRGPDGSVVFILDVSGSMYEPCAGSTRLALARDELARRIQALADGTPFAITVYAQTAQNSGPLVAAGDATRDAAIRFINEEFDDGGGTNLPAGLASAQRLHPGSLVLVTDGDLNIGLTTLLGNAALILGPDGQGPALSIVGISPRPDTDAELQLRALADQERGSYAGKGPVGDNDALLTATKAVMEIP